MKTNVIGTAETAVCGFFKMETFKKTKSGKEYERKVVADWFPNLITDSGLDIIPITHEWQAYCRVGTGNATPTASDIALVNQIASSNSGAGYGGVTECNPTSPYYKRFVTVKRFGQGVAAGNLSEVGMSNSATGNLFSRALILDTGGSPTTITVLADEYLDVTYEFRYYPKETDTTGNVTLTGDIGGTYAYTMRPALIQNMVQRAGAIPTSYWTGFNNHKTRYSNNGVIFRYCTNSTLSIITAEPTHTSLGEPDVDPYGVELGSEYTPGDYVNYIWCWLPPTRANHVDGIDMIYFMWGMCTFQCKFTPAIPKTAEDTLYLKFSHTYTRK